MTEAEMFDIQVDERMELHAAIEEWLDAIRTAREADAAHSAAYEAQSRAHSREQEIHKRLFERIPMGVAIVHRDLVVAKNPKGCLERFSLLT